MTGPITRESLKGAGRTLVMHGRLSRGGALFIWRCVKYPRLTRTFRRATGKVTPVNTYQVDGIDCASLDEAIARLNAPPPAITGPAQAELFGRAP